MMPGNPAVALRLSGGADGNGKFFCRSRERIIEIDDAEYDEENCAS